MDKKQLFLNKIVQHLILYTSSKGNLGLLSGKMGVCIFFYRYARHTGIRRYADFAGELLDEIYAGINIETPEDFEKGLAGICWGIEYLIREGFVDANADEVLGDIDSLILERDVRKMSDTSLETGLEGLAHYVLARCSDKSTFPIDRQYIEELKQNMENRACCQELTEKLSRLLKGEDVAYKFDLIDTIAAGSMCREKTLSTRTNLGVSQNGLAGVALQLIQKSAK